MTHFEKTALYERMADFIGIMDEDELHELASICKAKADMIQQNRREQQRIKLMGNLQDALNEIARAKFSVEIENIDNPNWVVKLLPDEIYSVKMTDVGK